MLFNNIGLQDYKSKKSELKAHQQKMIDQSISFIEEEETTTKVFKPSWANLILTEDIKARIVG